MWWFTTSMLTLVKPPSTSYSFPTSFVTLRVYEGVPLTQVTKEVGTSVRMIEQHYAGVVENWDGEWVPAEDQIRSARSVVDPQRTLWPTGRDS